jgi:N-dimethylarginine dimethylaminohydrolase
MATDLHQTRMATAAEPPFHSEIEEVWGRPWGAHDEVGRLKMVLVRPPGEALHRIRTDARDPDLEALVDPDGGWYWTRREAPDHARAAAQHHGLIHALEREGVEVLAAAPTGAGFTKAMAAAGVEVVTIPSDELHPNGGGVHCSTMELIREPAP